MGVLNYITTFEENVRSLIKLNILYYSAIPILGIYQNKANLHIQFTAHLKFFHANIHSSFCRCCTVAQSCLTFAPPWTATCQALLSITNPVACSNSCSSSWWCQPTISSSDIPSPPAFNLSQHQGLFLYIRWPKYWTFSFSISPSNECSGLISFRTHWFNLLAV